MKNRAIWLALALILILGLMAIFFVSCGNGGDKYGKTEEPKGMGYWLADAHRALEILKDGTSQYEAYISIIKTDADSGGFTWKDLGTDTTEIRQLIKKGAGIALGEIKKKIEGGDTEDGDLLNRLLTEANNAGVNLNNFISPDDVEKYAKNWTLSSLKKNIEVLARGTPDYETRLNIISYTLKANNWTLGNLNITQNDINNYRQKGAGILALQYLQELRDTSATLATVKNFYLYVEKSGSSLKDTTDLGTDETEINWLVNKVEKREGEGVKTLFEKIKSGQGNLTDIKEFYTKINLLKIPLVKFGATQKEMDRYYKVYQQAEKIRIIQEVTPTLQTAVDSLEMVCQTLKEGNLPQKKKIMAAVTTLKAVQKEFSTPPDTTKTKTPPPKNPKKIKTTKTNSRSKK